MEKLKRFFSKWVVICVATVILGIGFIIIYYVSSPKTVVIEILGTVGKASIGSGVFLFFLKAIQFLGVFQEEMRKIVYSDELLVNRSDIEEIWKKVTRAVFQSAFPTISTKIEDLIQQKILPRKLNYYHKDLHVVYEINKFDNNHFQIIESQNFVVVSDGKDLPFQLQNHYIKTDSDDDKSNLSIDLMINNESYNDKIHSDGPIILQSGQIQYSFDCSIVLQGSSEYFVKKITKSVHSIKLNGYWNFMIGRVTDSFTIDVRNNGNYEIDIIPYGNSTDLREFFVSSTLNISKHYDILTPGDGLLLLIKPKFVMKND